MDALVDTVDSTLRVSGHLDASCADWLQSALCRLLAETDADPVLDMSGIERISNACVCPIVTAALDASEAGRRMIVRAIPEVARRLTRVGATQFLSLIEVDPVIPALIAPDGEAA